MVIKLALMERHREIPAFSGIPTFMKIAVDSF
jgi:hypothetical protein